jgi:Spy/CpxP family protein refolding chaperone
MHRYAMGAVLALVMALPAAAQGGPGAPGGARRAMMEAPKSGQGVLEGITLSQEQQEQVDALWKANEGKRNEQMAAMRAMREAGTPPDSASMASMRAARQAQLDEYRKVLTPEQQKVFDQNVAAMRERAGGRGPAPGRP